MKIFHGELWRDESAPKRELGNMVSLMLLLILLESLNILRGGGCMVVGTGFLDLLVRCCRNPRHLEPNFDLSSASESTVGSFEELVSDSELLK